MVQSAAQKPQSPPPPPSPSASQKPAEQPAASGQAQQGTGAAQQPAQTQAKTGYATQDGFETQAQQSAARGPQGDTFESALARPSGGGVVSGEKAGATDAKLATALKDRGVVDALMKQARPEKIADPAKAPDPNDPTKGMTEEQRAAYDALPPEQRAAYDELHSQAATNTQTRTIESTEMIATPDSSVDALRDLLTSGRLGEYLDVEKAMGSDQARTDLRQLLFQGLLPGGTNLKDGRDTLSHLSELADPSTKLLDGIDRQQLLGSLVHDLNHPEEMTQGIDNTDCAATAVAFMTALNRPAEYARIISGLAQNGEVDITPWYSKFLGLFGGGGETDVLKLDGQFDGSDGRSPTGQLFGRAFSAEASSGDGLVERILTRMGLDRGIDGTELKDTLNEFGGGWNAVFAPDEKDPAYAQKSEEAKGVMRQMLENASPQRPVFVNVDNHWVAVTGYDPATGALTVYDPFARSQKDREDSLRTENIDTFMQQDVNSVVYQNGAVPEGAEVPSWMHDDAGAEDGGGGTNGGDYGGAGN